MFSQGGLSLEQAPPVGVVIRFFVTAAFFGLVLGLFLLGEHMNFISFPNQTSQIIIVHLLALGVMASFMFGALFQMLPVIAGVIIQVPTKKAMIAHVLLVLGLMTQLMAFSTSSLPLLYLISAVLLGAGLLYTTILMLGKLIQIKDHSSSSKGMLLALGSFTIAIVFGLYLLLSMGGYSDGTLFIQAKEMHYSFAIFGWVSLLIISISFQVVEMFYVTPKYPNIISRYLVVTLFALLTIKTIMIFSGLNALIIDGLLAILFILYALLTLHRLYKRKRPTSDATVWFWRLGMGLFIISMSLALLGMGTELSKSVEMLSYLSFIGFALSIVFAMVYKIVPFLIWFHLSNQGYMEAPMMHDVIHPKKAKIHFGIHLLMLTLWIFSFFVEFPEVLSVLASLLVVISFGWLLYHLIYAVKKYDHTQLYTEKMEW